MSRLYGRAAVRGVLLLGVAASVCAAGLLVPSARGQTATWNKMAKGGGLTSGDWKTAANWNPKAVPNGAKAQVVFPSGLAGNATISVDKTYSLISLDLDSTNSGAAYTIQSAAGAKGALKFLANPNNMGLFGAIPQITIPDDNTASHTIALPLIIDAGQALQITNDSQARLTISGAISGAKSNGLVFDGESEVRLSGTNTYAGKTIIDGGNVSIMSNAALGANGVGIELKDSGLLQGIGANASVAAGRTITLGDAVISSHGILAGDPNGTSVFTVNAKIQPGGLGDSDLSILNSVRLTNTANSFKTDQPIQVGDGTTSGTLYLRGNVEAKTDQVLGNPANSLLLTKGTIVAESTFTSARSIDLNLPGTIQVIKDKTLTLTGAITGGISTLTKSGPGTLVLQGNNTFRALQIAAGTAAVSADNNLGKPNTSVTMANGTTLRVDAPFSTTRGVAITGSATINANFANNPAAGKDFEIKGQVQGGNLIKAGTGIVTLSNANNSQSSTTINQGVLAVATDGALGPKTSKLTMGAGGTLRATDSFQTNRTISVTGATQPGAIDVVKGKTLTVQSGLSAGAARFLKSGDGTLALAKGSNSTIGLNAQVAAGRLVINGAFSTGTGLVNAKGAEVAGAGTVTGTFDNQGKVTPGNDPGTLTVTGGATMEAGSQFGFDINAANGGRAGGDLGWGLLAVGGVLNLLGPITIDLRTFDLSGHLGAMGPGLFDAQSSYLWEFAEAIDGISGFSPGLFAIDDSQFANPIAPGTGFSVVEQGNGLFLKYGPTAAVPEPSSLVLLLLAGLSTLAVGTLRPRCPALARQGFSRSPGHIPSTRGTHPGEGSDSGPIAPKGSRLREKEEDR